MQISYSHIDLVLNVLTFVKYSSTNILLFTKDKESNNNSKVASQGDEVSLFTKKIENINICLQIM